MKKQKRTCTICKKSENTVEFQANSKNCRSCKIALQNKKRQESRKERKIELKIQAILYKGSKCIDCGIEFPDYPPIVFDFHHENPSEKDKGLNILMKVKSKLEDIVEELDKCVLLCANCHRIRHKRESLVYETYVAKKNNT
jgi:predicted HNH restriction endonuclease